MYFSYCKSHYHRGTADLRHMWLVLVRLTSAFLSTPWLAGGWPPADTQLGWLFLPHCSSSLASRPAGASSHDSSGRSPEGNKRKPLMCRHFSSLFLWHGCCWPIAQGKSLVKPGSLCMGTTQEHGYKEIYPQLQHSDMCTVTKGRRWVPGLQFLFNLGFCAMGQRLVFLLWEVSLDS